MRFCDRGYKVRCQRWKKGYSSETMRIVLSIAALLLTLGPRPGLARHRVRATNAPGALAPDPPWRPRIRAPHEGLEKGYGLIDPKAMPAEPIGPAEVSAEQLAKGLAILCYRLSDKQAKRYAGWITQYSREFGVDPLIIAALIRRQSACSNETPKARSGFGLARLSHDVHERYLRDGSYHFYVLQNRAWVERERLVDRFRFSAKTLAKPEANIYFAAAILSVYAEQDHDLDRAFSQVPHRHAVSHLLWGDQVRGTEGEERILRDRRRLIEYITGQRPAPKNRYRGMALHCPLDGAPRKITSDYFSTRGRRRHKSLDFYSHVGEPVRAMAEGVVRFAGYQPRRGRGRAVHPKYSKNIRRSKMGIGGRFVIITHPKGLESGYFHLKDFSVVAGQRVKAGQQIGRVGRSGILYTRPHLHFEIRKGKWRTKVNPLPYLAGDVLPLEASWTGKEIKARRAWRRHARARRASARQKRQATRRKQRTASATQHKSKARISMASRRLKTRVRAVPKQHKGRTHKLATKSQARGKKEQLLKRRVVGKKATTKSTRPKKAKGVY